MILLLYCATLFMSLESIFFYLLYAAVIFESTCPAESIYPT